MSSRIAASLALIVFAVCLISGGLAAGNSLATILQRALLAMACSYVIGLVLGAMCRKMLDENLKIEEDRLRKNRKEPVEGR